MNCHGWQPNSPPIASTVTAFRILLADGSVRECRRGAEDRELFDAVCGGYELFGVILDVDLRVVPNALYQAGEFPATSRNFIDRFALLVTRIESADRPGLWACQHRTWPMVSSRRAIIRFVATQTNQSPSDVANTLDNPVRPFAPRPWEIGLARATFRASVGSDFGKLGRWTIERFHGQTHRIVPQWNIADPFGLVR